MCLDLSRNVNEVIATKSFRIESITDFLKEVKQGAWVWFYDLKSAYHHLQIVPKHRKYLGFSTTIDNQVRYFRFVAMPFRYRDAGRILTKIMRTPLTKWRAAGLSSYIHIDDGLGFCMTKKEATVAAREVRKDINKLGLVVSEEKC